MESSGTKEAAEALLRELPSVRGAFVREDVFGHPREIHILLSAGPAPRHFARDVRDLLEERLGVPVDQRVISIAQLDASASDLVPAGAVSAVPAGSRDTAADHDPQHSGEGGAIDPPAEESPSNRQLVDGDRARVTGHGSHEPHGEARPPALGTDAEPRLRFVGTDIVRQGGRISVTAKLAGGDEEYTGTDTQVDAPHARLRSGARALLDAANHVCAPRGRFELEDAARIHALGRDYVLLTVVAHSPRLGRRPLALAGAHPVEAEEEGAAALAALKAVNRVLALMLSDAEAPRRAR